MKLIYNIYELEQYISALKKESKSIGFVPTMGALHNGHLSLIKRAKESNNICICSIFINPTQFNNAEDYNKYPKTLDADIEILKHEKVDAVFMPSESEMYPEPVTEKIDLGGIDEVMEGKFRPGHFNGVAMIVKKLFDLVKPDRAYFGEKDFQQIAVVKYLVRNLFIPVEIIPCPTVRESDGLAMSSRNMRLDHEERKAAPLVYKTLLKARKKTGEKSVKEIKEWVCEQIATCKLMKLEYFEIVDSETLAPVLSIQNNKSYTACIAVFIGKIRLIDNLKFL